MTDYLCLLAGTLLLLLVIVDFLYTTISLAGLGPLSARLFRSLWRLGRAATLATERRIHLSIRGLIGPAILTALGASWMLLHFTAYTLLYLSGTSLVSSETGAPATLPQTIAFAGSALSTLGASTVQPTNGWWDMLSTLAAVNGMVVLTLSVSFVLNIIRSTTTARQWALRYASIRAETDTSSGDELGHALGALGPDLCGIAVDLAASPLASAFVARDAEASFPEALRNLIGDLERCELTSPGACRKDGKVAQLIIAIELIGRSVGRTGQRSDFEAARLWAEDQSLFV